ncbi:carbohydrate kinase, FGGY family protein [Leptospira johnsonii]|uniref:Carbohydrate kinase, FGGY family protein n=2 Tax=Leptospira johnsonii TaxID=1917820 RepID=A0A2P2D2A6_9LEPT|nr:carbohydrate kinase, FGGY family protein [Leptospira johnsonii]
MDMRGAEHIQNHAGGPVAGYSALKLWNWIRLTGGAPSLSGKDPAAHMLLIKNEFPQVYERTYKFLNALDYLNMKLTGKFVTTPDSILTSWVTDNRDSNRVCYDPSLLAASSIDPQKFPEIVRCTDVIGILLPEVASVLDLPKGTLVVGGSIDTAAAAIGSGAVLDGDAHLYIGTSSWIAAHVPRKKTDVISAIASVPCAIPGKYLMTAMQTTAGANLSFLKDRILYHQDELLREEHVSDVYKVLDRIAARTPAGSRGLLYMPWLYGERCPIDDLSLRGGMVNLSLGHSREDVIRAFLEGVALNTRWMIKPVEKFLKKNLSKITIVGGGATSDVWCQIFADTMGITVRQPEEPMQSNARGAAWIAGIGLGLMQVSDIPELIRIKAEYKPDGKNKKVMDEMFSRFLQLHKRLAPLYKSWNQDRASITQEKTSVSI